MTGVIHEYNGDTDTISGHLPNKLASRIIFQNKMCLYIRCQCCLSQSDKACQFLIEHQPNYWASYASDPLCIDIEQNVT
jgi:hypothetical protein